MHNFLCVIDMQNDFVSGVLGTKEARNIVPKVRERIIRSKGERILYTQDTHTKNYLNTEEGKLLPVEHCIINTEGWQFVPEISDLIISPNRKKQIFRKNTFSSLNLANYIKRTKNVSKKNVSKITIVGLCTDICILSNALLLKTFLPDTSIVVEKDCCAGTSKKKHEMALEMMKGIGISIE